MALEVLVAGDNCIDCYLPPIGLELVGGQAVNVAAGLAARGIATAYAGVVGTDDAGSQVAGELRRRGVDLRALEVREGMTGRTDVATEHGERRFVAEAYGVSAPYRPSPAALQLAGTVRLVYAAHVEGLAQLRRALAPSGLLAVDASEATDMREERAAADILFRSAPGRQPEEAIRLGLELQRSGVSVAVITLGELGAVAVGRDGVTAYRPPLGPVTVDTLGAGDALAAGFLAGWLRGQALDDALAAGAAAAHEACGHLGALPR